jgi:hypothetical protein
LALARLLPHISSSGNFNPLQSGFRSNHSTETALLKVTNDIFINTDNKSTTILLSLDISAAFDTMDHDLLTRRANIDFGIAGTALNWLSSYLHGRETYVAIGQTKSTRSTSSTGVPQGSVLGPFLFSMFVSPVGRIIKQFGVQHHQYADDTQLYTAIKSGTGQLNDISKCADAVTRWFLENGLLLNPSKTEAVIFGSRQQISKFTKNNNLTFSDTTLTTSNTVKASH